MFYNESSAELVLHGMTTERSVQENVDVDGNRDDDVSREDLTGDDMASEEEMMSWMKPPAMKKCAEIVDPFDELEDDLNLCKDEEESVENAATNN